MSDKLDKPMSLHIRATGEHPNYLARVPEIAERLGVEPVTGEHPPTFMLHVGGAQYDFFELLSAFLDKIEKPLV